MVEESSLHEYIPDFHLFFVRARNNLLPDLLARAKDNRLYVLELTIGIEINLISNVERKACSMLSLVTFLKRHFGNVSKQEASQLMDIIAS